MKINVFQRGGFKDNHEVLKHATEYFCKMLMSTRMCNTLNIRLEMRATKLDKDALGSCYTDAIGSQKNTDFTIMLQRDGDIKEQLETLAHEAVHIFQKRSNLLQYRKWKSDDKYHARWNGKEMGIYNEIPYLERPWEIEAFALEKSMFKAYFCQNKGRTDLEDKFRKEFDNTLKYLVSERDNDYKHLKSKSSKSPEMSLG